MKSISLTITNIFLFLRYSVDATLTNHTSRENVKPQGQQQYLDIIPHRKIRSVHNNIIGRNSANALFYSTQFYDIFIRHHHARRLRQRLLRQKHERKSITSSKESRKKKINTDFYTLSLLLDPEQELLWALFTEESPEFNECCSNKMELTNFTIIRSLLSHGVDNCSPYWIMVAVTALRAA